MQDKQTAQNMIAHTTYQDYPDEEECVEGKNEDVGKNDNDHQPR